MDGRSTPPSIRSRRRPRMSGRWRREHLRQARRDDRAHAWRKHWCSHSAAPVWRAPRAFCNSRRRWRLATSPASAARGRVGRTISIVRKARIGDAAMRKAMDCRTRIVTQNTGSARSLAMTPALPWASASPIMTKLPVTRAVKSPCMAREPHGVNISGVDAQNGGKSWFHPGSLFVEDRSTRSSQATSRKPPTSPKCSKKALAAMKRSWPAGSSQ